MQILFNKKYIMNKIQLLQVKIIHVEGKNVESVQKDINECIVEMYKETGNYPSIETNSRFITIKCNKLVVVK